MRPPPAVTWQAWPAPRRATARRRADRAFRARRHHRERAQHKEQQDSGRIATAPQRVGEQMPGRTKEDRGSERCRFPPTATPAWNKSSAARRWSELFIHIGAEPRAEDRMRQKHREAVLDGPQMLGGDDSVSPSVRPSVSRRHATGIETDHAHPAQQSCSIAAGNERRGGKSQPQQRPQRHAQQQCRGDNDGDRQEARARAGEPDPPAPPPSVPR